MLARSRLAWDVAAAGGSRLSAASYGTEAYTSQSGRMRPQIERAIRLKSQSQRRAAKDGYDERLSRSSNDKESQTPRQLRIMRPDRSFTSAQNTYTSNSRYSSSDYKQAPHQKQSRQVYRQADFNRSSEDRYTPRPSMKPSYRRDGPSMKEDTGSIRELRFTIARKLNDLVKSGRQSQVAAFAEGQKLFDSISGYAKREARIYNAMIRLAMRAGKRQWAIKTFNEVSTRNIVKQAWHANPRVMSPDEKEWRCTDCDDL